MLTYQGGEVVARGSESKNIRREVRQVFDILDRTRNSGYKDLYNLHIVLSLWPTQDSIDIAAVNLFSISQITGIPRETVRRRMADLIELGDVRRTDGGNYVLASDDRLRKILSPIIQPANQLSEYEDGGESPSPRDQLKSSS